MTDDTKTPDPTPALLSAARLADYRSLLAKAPTVALTSSHGSIFPADEAEQQARFDRRLDPTILQAYGTTEEMHPWAEFFAAAPDMTRALFAHLDALTPRAPVDGEALGLLLASAMAAAVGIPKEDYGSTFRGDHDRYVAGALALHAAGRSEGEAERARLAEEVANLRLVCSWDPTSPLDLAEARATIARLTAELAEARATLASVREQHEEERADLQREIAESESLLASAAADHDTARRDGAREEREACALTLESLDVRPEELEAIRDGAAAIRARGEGQGS